MQETDAIEFDNQTVLIAIAEDDEGHQQDNHIDGEESPEPGLHLLEIEGDEDEDGRGPQAEVREDVHHGIEHHATHGARRADVVGQLHDTIGTTTEAEGRGVTEGETRNGEFVGMAIGKVLVVRAVVDDNLKGQGIEGIDKDPHANDGGQIEAGTDDVTANLLVAVLKTERHHDEGGNAEEEEKVS